MPDAPQHAARPRVVILGGGFAGLSAARELADNDLDVLLVDRNLHNTFQPLLYQVASGGLNPGDITYSLRAFAGRRPDVRFQRGSVTGIDTERQLVHVDAGTSHPYDHLIVATGVGPNYLNIPGAQEHAVNIYTRNAALEVRDRIIDDLELLAQEHPAAKEPVIIVVGGGAVGVEMAGALADLRNTALPIAYPEIHPARVRIVLLEATDRLLAPFVPELRRYSQRELVQRGVEVRLRTSVASVHADRVELSDGTVLPSIATIWATGVKAPDDVARWGLPQTRGGRIVVRDDLRVHGHPNVFAVGDIAAHHSEPLPQLAPPAIQAGRHVAHQILRIERGEQTEPFRYRDKGIMATIGRTAAIVQMPGRIRLRGGPAWFTWVALHIVTLMGNRNRLSALLNLTIRYLSWKRSANIIVGSSDRTSRRT